MNTNIRIGQLIAPFGPGAIYTDRQGSSLVICGLDYWFKRLDPSSGMYDCDDPDEFVIFEPRLSNLLNVSKFFSPADYRMVGKGRAAPPNALVYTPAQRFPCWYRNTRTGRMKRFNLGSLRVENAQEGGRWLPVRFVSVCRSGHLCEFPWIQWSGCTCRKGEAELVLTDRGGTELSSIKVECIKCKKGRNLSGTTVKPDQENGEQGAFQKANIRCPGERPWLGEGAAEENCHEPLVGALINQTNLYFPRTISAISLPDPNVVNTTIHELRNAIEQDPSACGLSQTLWKMGEKGTAIFKVQESLKERGIEFDAEALNQALESLFELSAYRSSEMDVPSEVESKLLALRRSEFNIIRNEVNDADGIPNLRVIPSAVPEGLSEWFEKVNLVERLREVRAFFGFDRLLPNQTPLEGMPESAMNQLFRSPPDVPLKRWLPAVEVFGEGLYVELNEDKLSKWQDENGHWLVARLNEGFVTRLAGVFQTLPPLSSADWRWASRYLLVHSLAHILINQLVFECGYSSASLRERLYVSNDTQSPMAGILIYTAAGDSEGTLGGLVRLGRSERFEPIIRRALSRASWCSADPICSENLGGQGSKLVNLAACHGCTLLPETSCETINHGLDRAMLVGLPNARKHGFMSKLLDFAPENWAV